MKNSLIDKNALLMGASAFLEAMGARNPEMDDLLKFTPREIRAANFIYQQKLRKSKEPDGEPLGVAK